MFGIFNAGDWHGTELHDIEQVETSNGLLCLPFADEVVEGIWWIKPLRICLAGGASCTI